MPGGMEGAGDDPDHRARTRPRIYKTHDRRSHRACRQSTACLLRPPATRMSGEPLKRLGPPAEQNCDIVTVLLILIVDGFSL